MIPVACRIPILLASLLVPRSARKSWKQEWYAELSYRQRCGATLRYMLRSARGSFRDALWIRRQTPFSFRFLNPPLRLECLVLAIAVVLAFWNAALVPPRPQYANLDRLVRLEHDSIFMGTNDRFLWTPLLKKWETSKTVRRVASYRVFVTPVRYARVTPNFFDVLGVPNPARSALSSSGDANPVVVTYNFWRTQLGSSPRAVGSTFRAGNKDYKVAGILGRGFAFNGCLFFAPLGIETGSRAIAVLEPGVGRNTAETDLRRIARAVALGWRFDDLRLRPLRSQVSAVSIVLAVAGAMLGIAYVCMRLRKMTVYVWARIAFGILAVTAINLAAFRVINHVSWFFSILQFWVYLGLCAGAVFFVQRDQRSRCPTCLQRLRMPVSIGSWSSLILDRPTTEYVCPAGHGALVVSEALHDPDHWTVFDDSWHDLFVESGK